MARNPITTKKARKSAVKNNQDKMQAEPGNVDLRRFTLDFFAFFGATVRQADAPVAGCLLVELDEKLAAHFGKPALQLCFHHADAAAGYDLVAHGSRMFDRMLAYLNGRGASALLDLPSRYAGSEELLTAVRPLNASIADLHMSEQVQRLFVFNWRITYRSDDKREELYTVALDEEGRRLRLAGEAGATAAGTDAVDLEALFADVTSPQIMSPQTVPAPEGEHSADGANGDNGAEEAELTPARRLPPMTQLARLAEMARKIAIYHADIRCVAYEAEVLPRLYRTLNRLTTYYGQQIEEVYDAHDPTGEKRRALELDLERKIAEEVENHRLRVEVLLFSYAVFNLPVAVAEMTFSDGGHAAPLRVLRNRYSGVLERPRCHACGAEASALAVDRNGHLTCDDCIQQCATCQEIVCAACGVAPCPVCGKENCDSCGVMCWACGERACPEHISTCPICGDSVCHACQTECAACGTRQCRSHLHTDAVRTAEGEYQLICSACAVRCPACQQYSAAIETCAASGQRFCANCMVTCAHCGKRVGPGFYQRSPQTGQAYCEDCLQVCPACGALTADVTTCERCGAVTCAACGVLCAVCGRHACEGYSQRFAECGHAVCTEHAAICSGGGEEICPLCNEPCPICGQPVCGEHVEICRRCGQLYCPDCVDKHELCATCAGMIDEGDPVNLAMEPCAADPAAVELAPLYSWLRAKNERYVIYYGRSRKMTSAVVVVERTDGGRKVVWTQRFSLMDTIRDMLAGGKGLRTL